MSTPPSTRPALAIRNLTRRYGSLVAIDNLDITVNQGDIYGFLGPNGAGKTTAIRCIMGSIRPTTGSIRVFGESHPVRKRRHIGALVETPAFHLRYSGLTNLRYACAYAGLPRSVWNREQQRVLERVGLADRAKDRVGTYSLGMRQRLGLARALLGKPRLLVLDEPTNGLDPAGMADMRELLRSLALHDGITVLLSSHLLFEVQSLCNRVGILVRGQLKAQGAVRELLASHSGQPLVEVGSPNPQALQQALATIGGVRVRGPGDAGRLLVDHGALPVHELNRQLHQQGVLVSALIPAATKLEDVFLQVTQ